MVAMEDLTKTQTILLCLLVSFVTSIGTGIITVSLLQEAPTSVTQTIHQIVERTVEKVTPQNSTTTTKETVIVKEEDSLIDSIKKNSSSVVRIYQSSAQGQPVIVAIGIVVSGRGIILSDKRIIVPDHVYTAAFADGRQFPTSVVGVDDKNNNIYLQALSEPGYQFSAATIGNSDNVQLGQSVIALGGPLQNQVAVGRVNILNSVDGPTPTSPRTVTLIQTDNALKDGLPGTLLLNLSGQVIGIKMWQPDTAREDQFYPINTIKTGSQQYFDSPKNNNP